ncbi:MAG: hypothetical protein OXE50_15495, partial [Chloroflexi bacterium]|nr:hypothetical protein [Chloroflexota bacterium]
MKIFSFLFVSMLMSALLISCGGSEEDDEGGTGPNSPQKKVDPWRNIGFKNLPQEGMLLVDANSRMLEFSDGITIQAAFADSGAAAEVCRIQLEEETTYRICAENPGDDDSWDVVCKISNNGGITFSVDRECTASFTALKGLSDSIQKVSDDDDVFCAVDVDDDEGRSSLKCRDGWNVEAFEGDEDGHAFKRLCRTHFDGESLSGRCLDMKEVEETSGDTTVIKADAVKVAKLQITTWAGYRPKSSEETERDDGMEIKTFYKEGELLVGDERLPSTPKSGPEEDTTSFIFNITSGGPGDGNICSFSESRDTCTLSAKDLPPEKEEDEEEEEGDSAIPTPTPTSVDQCLITGNALGDCDITLLVQSSGFVDKKIVGKVSVLNGQDATWDGYPALWIKGKEVLDPHPVAGASATTKNTFATVGLPDPDDDDEIVPSECRVHEESGRITATLVEKTSFCAVRLTVKSTGYMTKFFQSVVSVYNDSIAQQMNPLSWPDNPYGVNPSLQAGIGSLSLEIPPTLPLSPTPREYNIVYRSRNTRACTVNPTTGIITPVAVGSCGIEVRETGNKDYPPSVWIQSPIIQVTGPGAIQLTGFSYSANTVAFGSTPPTLTAPSVNP